MVRQQHQRTADQIGGALVSGAQALAILRCSGSGAMCRSTSWQPPDADAAADHRAPVGSAGEGPWIRACGQRQHGDRAIDRRGMPRASATLRIRLIPAGNCLPKTDRRRSHPTATSRHVRACPFSASSMQFTPR